ncbi:MAG: hypothetical protein P8184_10055 [Calditrichia bacterium]
MWNIIFAEFRYTYKLALVLAGFIIPAALFYIQTSPTAGISSMLFPLCAATILQLLIFRSMEKRERQNILLPLSVHRIALARVSLIVLPAVFFYGIYFFLRLLFGDTGSIWHHDPFDMMMFFGLVLLGFSVFLILHDLFVSIFKNYKAAEFDVVVLLVIISGVLLGIPLALAVAWKNPSLKMLQVFCFIAGFVFLYPAVFSFERRRSYME